MKNLILLALLAGVVSSCALQKNSGRSNVIDDVYYYPEKVVEAKKKDKVPEPSKFSYDVQSYTPNPNSQYRNQQSGSTDSNQLVNQGNQANSPTTINNYYNNNFGNNPNFGWGMGYYHGAYGWNRYGIWGYSPYGYSPYRNYWYNPYGYYDPFNPYCYQPYGYGYYNPWQPNYYYNNNNTGWGNNSGNSAISRRRTGSSTLYPGTLGSGQRRRSAAQTPQVPYGQNSTTSPREDAPNTGVRGSGQHNPSSGSGDQTRPDNSGSGQNGRPTSPPNTRPSRGSGNSGNSPNVNPPSRSPQPSTRPSRRPSPSPSPTPSTRPSRGSGSSGNSGSSGGSRRRR